MVKLAAKVLVLIGFIVLALNFLGIYFIEPSLVEKKLDYLDNESPLDVAFFGSSHAHSSYDPRVIEAELGLNSLNFGFHAQRFEITQLIATHVLEKKQPKLAIIDIYKNSFLGFSDSITLGLNLKTIDNLPASLNKVTLLASTLKAEEVPFLIWPTLRNHAKWKNLYDYDANRRVYKFHGQENFKGFQSQNNCFNRGVWNTFVAKYKNRNLKREYKDLTKEEKALIENLISVFSNKNIPILFVNAPSYVNDYDSSSRRYTMSIKNYLSARGYPFLDFNKIKDSIGLNKTHYRDPNHLNGKGAYIVTKYLSEYIKRNYKWNFNTDNRIDEKSNRYIHFENELQNVLYLKEFNPYENEVLQGIVKVGIYQLEDDLYELIFETKKDSIDTLKIKLSYLIKDEELSYLAFDKMNIINDKVRYFDILTQCNLYRYEEKNYLVFPFQHTLPGINDLQLEVGDKLDTELFVISSDSLKK
tara:strand:+ start:25586 stop:27001 length:1416 start_codon:yes stop_codon:yes gene_type:complete